LRKQGKSPLGLALDKPWYLVLLAVAVLFTFWAVGTRSQAHHVKVSFATAFNLVPGLAVSVDGLEVGKLGKVRYDNGKPLVEVGINDGRFWPLHAGTKVVSRWGTTIGSGTRRLDLIPGPATEPAIPEGGIIPTADTQAAVDVDQLLNSLNNQVRGHLRTLMGSTDAALSGHSRQLNSTLHNGASGVAAAGDIMSDLSADTFALRSLITNGQRLTSTIAARSEGVKSLITVAAETFHTFAQNTRGTQDSIAELPATLRQAHSTLGRVDTSVDRLQRLMVALAPGARRLVPLAAQARPALAQLRKTVPSALATVSQATTAAPNVSSLLDAATPFMQASPATFGGLAPVLACLRPYAPELGGAFVGAGGAHQNFDLINPALNPQIVKYVGRVRADGRVEQHGLRAMPMVSENTLEKPLNSAQFAQVSGKQYAFPRPPGLTTGQPWFIPECGITPDGLNPAKDPETAR
jgi:ABC-type transporter Mla subunit MlaD